ncbi:MAG: type II toxin-antitoxin system Phd/YefM family antitoxin, partial [Acidobacteria bacterium]|nr:type II toxin-antitoxin system Phd/YefM family antitoxin [Acidobacteriota bacterium]
MRQLSIFNAKNKLSQVVTDAEAGEPTMITRNGHEAAVVISVEEYRRTHDERPSFVEFLLSGPLRGTDIDFERSKDTGREP